MKLIKIFILFSSIVIVNSCGKVKTTNEDDLTKFLKNYSYDTNSVNVDKIREFLSKDVLTVKDTTKFYNLAKLKKMKLRELDEKLFNYSINRVKIDSSKPKSFVLIPRQF